MVSDRLTLRKSSGWPTVSLIFGGVIVLLIGLASLHIIIRSYVEPAKASAKASATRQVDVALAGAVSGPSGSTVVQTIRITPQTTGSAPPSSPIVAQPASPSPAPTVREAQPEPRSGWAMATPPTWLATVDAGAGLGVPTEVGPSAPIADTIPQPKAAGLAAATALALLPRPLAEVPALETPQAAQQVAQLEDVPLPRVRPKTPAPRPKASSRKHRRR